MTRPCQQKHWSQCKQRRNKQPRVGRWVRYWYHISGRQPTITSALSQHNIRALGCIMKGSFLKIVLWLSNPIGISTFLLTIFILSKKKWGAGTGTQHISDYLVQAQAKTHWHVLMSLIWGILNFPNDSYLLNDHWQRSMSGNFPEYWTVHIWFQIQAPVFWNLVLFT